MQISLPLLANVAPSALTLRLYEIRRGERALLVEMLAYLAEVDRRRLHLELGYSSLFTFLTDYLGYVKSAAFRRAAAARLLTRFPIVADYLADGRLSLTTLVELREILEEASLVSTLDRAAGRTEEQVKELVAALRPRLEPRDLFRRLPTSSPSVAAAPAPTSELTLPLPVGPPPPSPPPPRPTITPISEERRVLRVTVGREFVADLEAVKAALSHQVPDGNLETVLHECLRRTLSVLTRRRQGTGRGRKTKGPAKGRYIPAAVRSEVFRRDEGRCTFVGTDGHRCGSTYQIQIHHIRPFALGGEATVANLSLVCGKHNRHIAAQEMAAA